MGAQRIATNLISYPFDHDNPDLELIQAPNEEDIGYTAISTGAPQDLMATLDCLYGESQTYTTDFLYLQSIGEPILMEGCPEEVDPTCLCEMSTYFANFTPRVNCDEIEIIYFYHPDYLGSVEFITDMRGEPYQFFLNTPFGENLENQFAKNYTSFSSRFRFNGKEWDEETGLYYYGARYYDPKISVWLSVDPLASEAPHLTPYRFSFNNPLNVVDPTGLFEDIIYLDADNNELARIEQKGKDLFFRETNFSSQYELLVSGVHNKDSWENLAVCEEYFVFEGERSAGRKRVDGQITHTVSFDDGSTFGVQSWDALSGSRSLKPIPNGEDWLLDNLSYRDERGNWYNDRMIVDGHGFSINIGPDRYERSLLRIHPDGGAAGTQGCIGLTGAYKDLVSFENKFREIMGRKQSAVRLCVRGSYCGGDGDWLD